MRADLHSIDLETAKRTGRNKVMLPKLEAEVLLSMVTLLLFGL